MKKYQYKGFLSLYYETGMEGCWAAILQEDRGVRPNPDYDCNATAWPKNVPDWYDIGWGVNFHNGDHLTVYDKQNNVLFKGVLHKDRVALERTKYSLSFIPEEIDYETWVQWLKAEYRAEVKTAHPCWMESPQREVYEQGLKK